MAQANTEIDFYPRKIYHCQCFRGFLEKLYNQQCLRSINETIYVLEKEQDIKFKCKMSVHKKLKKNKLYNCFANTFWPFFVRRELWLSNDRWELFSIRI